MATADELLDAPVQVSADKLLDQGGTTSSTADSLLDQADRSNLIQDTADSLLDQADRSNLIQDTAGGVKETVKNLAGLPMKVLRGYEAIGVGGAKLLSGSRPQEALATAAEATQLGFEPKGVAENVGLLAGGSIPLLLAPSGSLAAGASRAAKLIHAAKFGGLFGLGFSSLDTLEKKGTITMDDAEYIAKSGVMNAVIGVGAEAILGPIFSRIFKRKSVTGKPEVGPGELPGEMPPGPPPPEYTPSAAAKAARKKFSEPHAEANATDLDNLIEVKQKIEQHGAETLSPEAQTMLGEINKEVTRLTKLDKIYTTKQMLKEMGQDTVEMTPAKAEDAITRLSGTRVAIIADGKVITGELGDTHLGLAQRNGFVSEGGVITPLGKAKGYKLENDGHTRLSDNKYMTRDEAGAWVNAAVPEGSAPYSESLSSEEMNPVHRGVTDTDIMDAGEVFFEDVKMTGDNFKKVKGGYEGNGKFYTRDEIVKKLFGGKAPPLESSEIRKAVGGVPSETPPIKLGSIKQKDFSKMSQDELRLEQMKLSTQRSKLWKDKYENLPGEAPDKVAAYQKDPLYQDFKARDEAIHKLLKEKGQEGYIPPKIEEQKSLDIKNLEDNISKLKQENKILQEQSEKINNEHLVIFRKYAEKAGPSKGDEVNKFIGKFPRIQEIKEQTKNLFALSEKNRKEIIRLEDLIGEKSGIGNWNIDDVNNIRKHINNFGSNLKDKDLVNEWLKNSEKEVLDLSEKIRSGEQEFDFSGDQLLLEKIDRFKNLTPEERLQKLREEYTSKLKSDRTATLRTIAKTKANLKDPIKNLIDELEIRVDKLSELVREKSKTATPEEIEIFQENVIDPQNKFLDDINMLIGRRKRTDTAIELENVLKSITTFKEKSYGDKVRGDKLITEDNKAIADASANKLKDLTPTLDTSTKGIIKGTPGQELDDLIAQHGLDLVADNVVEGYTNKEGKFLTKQEVLGPSEATGGKPSERSRLLNKWAEETAQAAKDLGYKTSDEALAWAEKSHHYLTDEYKLAFQNKFQSLMKNEPKGLNIKESIDPKTGVKIKIVQHKDAMNNWRLYDDPEDFGALEAAKDLVVAAKKEDGKIIKGKFAQSHENLPGGNLGIEDKLGFVDKLTGKFIDHSEAASYLGKDFQKKHDIDQVLGYTLYDLHKSYEYITNKLPVKLSPSKATVSATPIEVGESAPILKMSEMMDAFNKELPPTAGANPEVADVVDAVRDASIGKKPKIKLDAGAPPVKPPGTPPVAAGAPEPDPAKKIFQEITKADENVKIVIHTNEVPTENQLKIKADTAKSATAAKLKVPASVIQSSPNLPGTETAPAFIPEFIAGSSNFRLSWYSRGVRQTQSVLEGFGNGGKELAARIKMVDDASYIRANNFLYSFDRFITQIPKKMREMAGMDLMDVLEGRKQSSNLLPQGLVEQVQKMFGSYADDAKAMDFWILLQDGTKVPWAERANFAPRMVKSEFIDGILREDGATLNRVKQYFLESKQVTSDYQASQKVTALRRRYMERRYGHLERAREYDLPPEFYDRQGFSVIPEYVRAASHRLEEVRQFGQHDVQVIQLLDRIAGEGHDAVLARQIFDRYTGAEVSDEVHSRLVQGIKNLTTGMAIQLPSTITQLGQILTPIHRAVSPYLGLGLLKAYGRAAAALTKSFTTLGKEQAARAGQGFESVATDFLLDTYGGVKRKPFGKFAEKSLEWSGFSGEDSFWRRYSALLGRSHIKNELIPRILKDANNKYAVTELRRLGLNPSIVRAQGGLSDFELNLATKRFADQTQGAPNVLNLPLWWTSPTGRFMTQFHSFSVVIGKENYLLAKDMIRTGNINRLISMGVGTPLVGIGISYLKEDMLGLKPNDYGFDKDTNNIIKWYMNGTSFGVMADLMLSLSKGRSAFTNAFVAPSLAIGSGLFYDTLAAVRGDKKAAKRVGQKIPVVGRVLFQ